MHVRRTPSHANPRHRTAVRGAACVLLALFLATLPGCDRSSTSAEHGEPASLELRERGGTGALLAWTEGTGSQLRWEGGLPTLQPGDEIALDATFRDDDGHTIPLVGEFTVNALLATGSPSGIVTIAPHGDHVDLEALAPGTVGIVFQLFHGNHSDWESPALELVVTAAGAE